jgi:molybdopterin-binding protein
VRIAEEGGGIRSFEVASSTACCGPHDKTPRPTRRQNMKLSARNVMPGKIVAITRGMTTSHVKIEVAAGIVITASITNEAVDDLGLAVGHDATAIVKASDVIVGVN